MKRTLGLSFAALAAVALFAGLVHAVLVATGVSEPAATTVYGPTSRRLWATTAGALALVRSVRRIGHGGRRGAMVALVTGPIAAVNGGLVLALATGGPGSGNGVVGGAGALVLGLIGMTFGGLALRRSRRIA
jgi:peptidoglycan/LPS O-acetylase OafA/YrhL